MHIYICTYTHQCIHNSEPAIKKSDKNAWWLRTTLYIQVFKFLNLIHTDIFRIWFSADLHSGSPAELHKLLCLLGLLWFTLPAWTLCRPWVPTYPHRKSHTLDSLYCRATEWLWNEISTTPVHSFCFVLLRLNTAMQSTLYY